MHLHTLSVRKVLDCLLVLGSISSCCMFREREEEIEGEKWKVSQYVYPHRVIFDEIGKAGSGRIKFDVLIGEPIDEVKDEEQWWGYPDRPSVDILTNGV